MKNLLIILTIIILVVSGCAADSARRHNLAANTFISSKQYDEAIKEAKQSTTQDPNCTLDSLYCGWEYLGVAYYRKGNYSEAISAFKKATELKPQNSVMFRWLGISYHHNKQYQEAVNALKKAIELKPSDPKLGIE